MDRLEHFRELMRRLDPTRPLRGDAEGAWYVARPDAVATLLARSLQVDPTSANLVVGSIGTGKSTELLATQPALGATSGVFCHYVDVNVTESSDAADVLPRLG